MNSKLFQIGMFFGLVLLAMPTLGFAAEYKPLVGIPGIEDQLTFDSYINALYALSISIAGLLAVIKLIIAGLKWMLTGLVTTKQEAISDIQGAVFGLVIVLSAVVILNTINPNITSFNTAIDQITPPAAAPAVVPDGTLQNGEGYVFAKAGAIANFKTTQCGVRGAVYMTSSHPTYGPIEICYSPLSTNAKTQIAALFPGWSESQLSPLYTRFQTGHFPRWVINTDSIKSELGAVSVLFAVNIGNPDDWIDNLNQTTMYVTCDDIRRAQSLPVVEKNGGSYIACVVMPE
jgi:hypothetical protein